MTFKKTQLKEVIKAIASQRLKQRYGNDKWIYEGKETPDKKPAAPAAAPPVAPSVAVPPVAPSVALPPVAPPAIPPTAPPADDKPAAKPIKKKGGSADTSGATSGNSDVRSPTSTSTDVRSPTSTDVRSPTSTKTSTDAYTAGNVTVTGGAGSGDTSVHITQVPANTGTAIKGRNISPEQKRAEMGIDNEGDPSSMSAKLGKDSGGDSSMKADLGKESPSSMGAKLGKSDVAVNKSVKEGQTVSNGGQHKNMKLKKSQLKEAIKAIARDCLNERHDSGQQKKIKQIVEFVIRKVPSIKRNPKKISEVAGQLFKKQFGVAAKPNLLMEAAYKIVAPRSATDAKEDKARRIQYEPKVNETQTLPPNKGQYKTVAPHAYTTADQNKALTFQSDPKVNEMGLTSGLKPDETECEPCGEEGQYDEHEEIKLIKVVRLAADKLEAMYKGMSGDENPESFPPEADDDQPTTEPEEPSGKPPFGEPEEPFPSDTEEPSEEEPSDEPKAKEPPFKKKKEKKEEDPTEFTKKLAKENHKVQKRSYVTSNDNPVNPKNLRDPNVPGT